MHIVGRDEEIAALDAALDAVTRGESTLVVVRGEAGIGKTRLLARLGDEARRRRIETVTGRATELEAGIPLALFRDALPGLTLAPHGDADSRWELCRNVGDRLTAARTPVVILDDVHWADPVSREVLDAIVRRPPGVPHLLVVAGRPGPVVDAITVAARSAGRACTVLELGPLDRAAADELIGSILSDEARGRAFRASGGNPMFLEELARAGGSTDVPRGVVAAVRNDVASVSPQARELVHAGAVLGDPFDIDLARRLAGMDLDVALAAVDELVDRGLVRGTGTLREFAFRHPLVRSAVYEGQSVALRLAGHGRAAEVLAESGAAAADRAPHLAHSAGPGDLAAAEVLREGAATVRAQAPSIAADWLLAARRIARPTDLAPYSDLAETLVQSGRLAEALEVADDGTAIGTGSDLDRRRLHLAAASVERLLGRQDASLRRLTRVLADTTGAAGKADVAAALAVSAYQRGDYAAMAQWAGLARDEAAAQPLVRGVAAALVAVVQQFEGRAAESTVEADVAVRAVFEASDAELAVQAETLTVVPWALVAVERLGDALATARRGSAAARQAGNLAGAVPMLVAEVLALGLLGRIDQAVAAADRAELSARLAHNGQSLQWALWMRAWVLLDAGELDSALAAAIESVALAEQLDQSALVTIGNAVLGSVLLATGRADQGRPLLAAYDVEPGWIARWAPRLVETELALGDLDAAESAARRAQEMATATGLIGARAAAGRASSMAALARGDTAAALRTALEAVRFAESADARLDEAQAHILVARALAGSDTEDAVRHLRLAHSMATDSGARRAVGEATRELRRLGRRIGQGGRRGSGDTGIDGLSGREREIADLVAQGMTNRQIAGRLFISEKTVESHLSKAFSKLGVNSRAALAAEFSASR